MIKNTQNKHTETYGHVVIVALIAFMTLVIVPTANAAECISWKWIQTGSHTECSGWYCWSVPEYSIVCTEYAQDVVIVQPTEEHTSITQTPTIQQQGSAVFNFGSSDVNRYNTFMNQDNSRADYYKEIIANSYGFSPKEFETKYNLTRKNE